MSSSVQTGSLRVGIVGAGQMGEHHARILSSLRGVELTAVVDPDPIRRDQIAERYHCEPMAAVEALIGTVDAATVAVPTNQHANVGALLLNSGIHCLIEKPLATNEEDCQRLIHAARRNGCKLHVGHVERFNPAVEQLGHILRNDHAIHAIDARRMSTVSQRVSDVDVVMDLMVHDIDIALALMKRPVVEVAARAVRTGETSGNDYVTALLTFEHGGLASLTASRITQNKIREIQVTSDLGTLTANYITQELLISREGRMSAPSEESKGDSSYVLDLSIERVLVRSREPLVSELRHFCDSAMNGVPPTVPGEQALEALRLVWMIQEKIVSLAPDATNMEQPAVG